MDGHIRYLSGRPCGIDELYSKITTGKFYSTLVELLHNSPGTVSPDQSVVQGTQQPSPLPQSDNNRLSYIDFVRRKTAYLAYQLVSPWRDSCRSQAELIALFWAQYRHLLIFVFPSIENLTNCPVWYRPEPTILLQDHPGYIDYIVWPRVRERLNKCWHEHDTENLVRALIRGFGLCNIDIRLQGPLIYTGSNSELQLSQHFERALADISNFHTQPRFLADLPDLTVYGCTGPHISKHASVRNGGNATSFISQNSCPVSGTVVAEGHCAPHEPAVNCPLSSFKCLHQTNHLSNNTQAPEPELSPFIISEATTADPINSHFHVHGVHGSFGSTSGSFADTSFLNSTVSASHPGTWQIPEYEITQAATITTNELEPAHHISHPAFHF
ncbi:hypothetical protein BJY01DRAFT_1350 [Aspergillus pseudoustus]|uniref:Aminotransferase-like plant mobile domain-containing protein n=1 Tax=Aspergillus pseudoustus TaxID=1810923 RepID=A0ABR4L231_9EURO